MNTATETLEAVDIVGLLGDLITDNGLATGDRLPSIRELAAQFGVKAGTVRDALPSSSRCRSPRQASTRLPSPDGGHAPSTLWRA